MNCNPNNLPSYVVGKFKDNCFFFLLPNRVEQLNQKIHTIVIQLLFISPTAKTFFHEQIDAEKLIYMTQEDSDNTLQIHENWKDFFLKRNLFLPETISVKIVDSKNSKIALFSRKIKTITNGEYKKNEEEAKNWYNEILTKRYEIKQKKERCFS